MGTVLESTLPVFLIVAAGWLLASRRRVSVAGLSEVALYVTSPALVFTALQHTPMDPSRWSTLVGGTVWIVVGTGLVALAVLRRRNSPRSGFLLPVLFWNSGNLVLPCAHLAFGEEGLRAAAVTFMTVLVLHSTVGIWIASGRGDLREILRVPLVYACVGGIFLSVTGLELPGAIQVSLDMLGAAAIPLLLLHLGIQLRSLEVSSVRDAVTTLVIRMGGGLVLGLVFVALFRVSGVERSILLLNSIMPPAVLNLAFAERFGAAPRLVASSILLGTLASVIAIPTLLAFLV